MSDGGGVKGEVRKFIVDQFKFGQDSDGLAEGDSLLDNGLIDSTGVLEVVMFLEQRYGINIQDNELVPSNLDSIESIARFVAGKQGSGSGGG